MSGPEGFVRMGRAADQCSSEDAIDKRRRPPHEAVAQAAALLDFQGRRQAMSFHDLLQALAVPTNGHLRHAIKDGLLELGYRFDGKYWWSK